jgi:hypothetical protein
LTDRLTSSVPVHRIHIRYADGALAPLKKKAVSSSVVTLAGAVIVGASFTGSILIGNV